MIRSSPNGDQELVVVVGRAAIVDHGFRARLEPAHRAAQPLVDLQLIGAQPDSVERLPAPEPFGKGRALVGRNRLGTDQPDRAVGIDLPDSANRGIGRHAAANDEVSEVMGHDDLLLMGAIRRTTRGTG
jgi:hypothetical protein